MNSIELHSKAHNNLKRFQGYSITKKKERIKELLDDTNSKRILDYGCGKGMQYLQHRLHDYWGVPLPTCYDPCIPALSRKPRGMFDAVLCVDVMEHVDGAHVEAVLRDIISSAKKVVYFNISTKKANKTLPDGQNAHVTIKPKAWWVTTVNNVTSSIFNCTCNVIIDFTEEQ